MGRTSSTHAVIDKSVQNFGQKPSSVFQMVPTIWKA
jgi:hypothetical protein